MSAPWDVVGTPLHCLHTLHKEAMAAFSLEEREEALFGGPSPWEVVRSGRYVSLDVGGAEGGAGGGAEGGAVGGAGGGAAGLQEALSAALAHSGGAVLRLVGGAGVGKTTALQRLLADWASGARLTHFAFLFPLALGRLGSGERSLADLLSQQHPHLPPASLQLALQDPSALLFVLDGLDQNQDQDRSGAAPPCSDPQQPAPLSALVSGLVRRTLLHGASVLLTSRPTAPPKRRSWREEEQEEGQKEGVEVRGLSRAGRGAYMRQLFPEGEVEEVLEHLEQTLGLCELARLPSFCWTLRCVYRQARTAGRALPQTLTHVLADATASLLQRHALGAGPGAELLAALGKMAAAVLLEGGGRCSREELAAFGVPPYPDSPAVRDFLRPHGPAHAGRAFSFLSPALPHFLLALAYHRGSWDRGGVAELLERAGDEAGLLELFLAGLSDPSQRALLEAAAGPCDSGRSREVTSWLQEITQEAVRSYYKQQHLRCFRLLQQRQDPALTRTAIGPSARLGLCYGGLSAQDSAALSYVFVCCGELEQLNLYHSQGLSQEVLLRLVPAIGHARKLILSQSRLSEGAYTPLGLGLRQGTVRELDLSSSHLGDRGTQSLCTALEGSSVQILRLSCCKITEQGCEYLASALRSSPLHLLDLWGNDIKDAGLQLLSQSLRSPQCQLQELGVGGCELTGVSMEALSAALRSRSSVLRSVQLRQNQLGDAGMKWISTALRDPHCPLQTLLLSSCYLTEVCCADLAEALRTAGGALTELELSVNELGDTGVLQLTRAFKAAGCVPRILRLTRCEFGEQTFRELAAVMRMEGSPLRELEVGLHEVGDAGAKLLWDALRDPACKLEHLDVEMLGLTDRCVAELCAAVKASSSLKSLVLKNNQLTDAAVPALIAMAKDSRTLRELNLQYNDFSEDAFELLDACGKIKY